MSSAERPILSVATLVEGPTDLASRLHAAQLCGRPLLAATDRPLVLGFVDAVDARGCSRTEARNRVLAAASGWLLWLEQGERVEPEAFPLLEAWMGKPASAGGPGEALAAPVALRDPTGLPRTALRLMRACPQVRFVATEAPEVDGPLHPSPVITVHQPVLPFAGFDQAARLFQGDDPEARRQALEELRALVKEHRAEVRILALCALIRYALHHGDYAQALELAFDGLRVDPRFAELPCLIADVYRAQNAWELARLWYRVALSLRRPTWALHSDPLKYGWEPWEGIVACNRRLPLEQRDPPVFRQPRPRYPQRATVLVATCGPLAPSVLQGFLAQTWEDRELLVVDDGFEPDLRLKNLQDPRVTYCWVPGQSLSLGRKLELLRERVQGARIFVWEPRAAYAPEYLERCWQRLDTAPIDYCTGFWVVRQEDGSCGFLRPSKKLDDRGWFGTGLACTHELFQRVSFRDSDRDALLFFIEDGEARDHWTRPWADSDGLWLAELGYGDLAAGLADFEAAAPEPLGPLQARLAEFG